MLRKVWESFGFPTVVIVLVILGVRAEADRNSRPQFDTISGTVSPGSRVSYVTASNPDNTVTTETDSGGKFVLSPVLAGSHSYSFHGRGIQRYNHH